MNLKKIFKRNQDAATTNYVNNSMPTLINKQTALKNSTVYRSVDLLSNSVAQLPLYPYSIVKGEKKILFDHPTYKLLVSPNRRMSRFMFFKQIIVDMLLCGNSFVFVDRNEKNEPI
jgi:HK97 family phage portal protein